MLFRLLNIAKRNELELTKAALAEQIMASNTKDEQITEINNKLSEQDVVISTLEKCIARINLKAMGVSDKDLESTVEALSSGKQSRLEFPEIKAEGQPDIKPGGPVETVKLPGFLLKENKPKKKTKKKKSKQIGKAPAFGKLYKLAVTWQLKHPKHESRHKVWIGNFKKQTDAYVWAVLTARDWVREGVDKGNIDNRSFTIGEVDHKSMTEDRPNGQVKRGGLRSFDPTKFKQSKVSFIKRTKGQPNKKMFTVDLKKHQWQQAGSIAAAKAVDLKAREEALDTVMGGPVRRSAAEAFEARDQSQDKQVSAI